MRTIFFLTAIILCSCSRSNPAPDKTVAGGVLGAGWGAGAGAIIGQQISYTGEGALVGAGLGLLSGAIGGAGYDAIENIQIEHDQALAGLRIQNMTSSQELAALQSKLDRSITSDLAGGVYQVFFDEDSTNLRSGAIANLEIIADQIKSSAHASKVHVVGHSDDAGTPEYSSRTAEARARAVSSYIAARGISSDQILVESHGSSRPIATNATPIGRQLNRRVDVYISR